MKKDEVPGPPGPPKGRTKSIITPRPHQIHQTHAPPPPKTIKAAKESKVSSDESESDSEADEREEMEERARLQLREMNEELGIEEKPLEGDVNGIEAVQPCLLPKLAANTA